MLIPEFLFSNNSFKVYKYYISFKRLNIHLVDSSEVIELYAYGEPCFFTLFLTLRM